MPSTSNIDLVKLFQTTSKTVGKNRESLNQADEYNHDHGDNMVQIFNVITEAVKAKKKAEPSTQLAYAAELLQQRSKSGSAQLYSQGLANAAQRFQGKQVTKDNAVQLIQSLLGGGQSAQATQQPAANAGADLLGALLGGGQTGQQPSGNAGADLLGALLGGGGSAPGQQSSGSAGADLLGALLGGGGAATSQQSSGSAGADLLGALLGGGAAAPGQQPAASTDGDVLNSLLGGLLGGGGSQQASDGLDASDLLSAGLAFMQAKQQGKSTLEALVSAVLSGSQLNNSPYRSQSGQLVANALLQAVASMAK